MSKKKLEHLLAELEREIAGLRHVDARSLARLKEVEAELKEKITALESSVRYLACDLGPAKIRVNAISAGPLNTLAARGIHGFTDILKLIPERAPLRRNIDASEVGDAALFLLSPLSRGVTGEILHVDAGFHIVGL